MVKTVAVVEDNTTEVELLQKYFLRFEKEHGETFRVVRFGSGDEFLRKYRPIYHLVFMDIGLPGIDGMEAARRLRKTDSVVTLIFVTNMVKFAVKGYEVNAYDFLVKPVTYASFALKLQRALKNLKSRQGTELVLNIDNQFRRISTAQIQYIEVSNHNLIYHTGDGPIRAYGNLKDVETMLNGKAFARCNSCYLVNLNYVRAIRGYVVEVGDKELQISRPKRKAFVQALNDYLGGGI